MVTKKKTVVITSQALILQAVDRAHGKEFAIKPLKSLKAKRVNTRLNSKDHGFACYGDFAKQTMSILLGEDVGIAGPFNRVGSIYKVTAKHATSHPFKIGSLVIGLNAVQGKQNITVRQLDDLKSEGYIRNESEMTPATPEEVATARELIAKLPDAEAKKLYSLLA